jgi:HTH-type transcriptional regulator, sugar sensing transcriptional regulator
MTLTDALRNLGFTQQEAIIYTKLTQSPSMTGYEAAKTCGISRSNAYASLSNLVEKGYAYTIEGNPVHYLAITKTDLIANAKRDFSKTIELIEEKLTANVTTSEPYITVTGEKSILNKLKNIISQAEQRIYLSVNNMILREIEEELVVACEKGLKIVILSSEDISCGEHTYYHTTRNASIKLITDTKEILAGTLNQCLYSKNATLVNIIRESIIDEISLITGRSN